MVSETKFFIEQWKSCENIIFFQVRKVISHLYRFVFNLIRFKMHFKTPKHIEFENLTHDLHWLIVTWVHRISLQLSNKTDFQLFIDCRNQKKHLIDTNVRHYSSRKTLSSLNILYVCYSSMIELIFVIL